MLWEIEQGRLAFWHKAEKCFRDHGCKSDTVGSFFEVTGIITGSPNFCRYDLKYAKSKHHKSAKGVVLKMRMHIFAPKLRLHVIRLPKTLD